jgi:hypothetical protein
MSPHYHTACRRCGAAIIMQPGYEPPHNWIPRDWTGQAHDCPYFSRGEVADPQPKPKIKRLWGTED